MNTPKIEEINKLKPFQPCKCGIIPNDLIKNDNITKCERCLLRIKNYATGDIITDDKIKAYWQRFWLRHCLSEETDFTFSVLGFDKECEVKEMAKSLDKDQDGNFRPLAKWIENPEGIKTYKIKLADWFLRRYNRKAAKKILTPLPFYDKVSLLYPRLIGSIIIGLIVIMLEKDMWILPLKIDPPFLVIIQWIVLNLICWIYFTYESYNIIYDKIKAVKRGGEIWLVSTLTSIFLSSVLCLYLGHYLVDNYSKTYLSDGFIFADIFFFSSTSLFIGIFIQVIWEEKSITEPL